ncbi:hypothetical protein RND71_014784 [Anisodus tanguticus]|uniref:Uncharacterized protein n=1 Tax=Anisodus tanguticus TaxID=243964 RepID=A0AAE1SC99_9SOLA|nr:hypothetical protein RND71_014784 [Anisodus tanguticus]
MASSIRIESSSASRTVCLTCGDEGDTKLLIYCLKCRDSAVHQFLVASSQNPVLSLNKFLVGYEQLKWVLYCVFVPVKFYLPDATESLYEWISGQKSRKSTDECFGLYIVVLLLPCASKVAYIGFNITDVLVCILSCASKDAYIGFNITDDFAICLEKFSHDDDNIDWICWDCAPRVAKIEQFRKSERISERKIRAFDV